MPRFTEQFVYCNVCGKEFVTAFGIYEGRVCSSECFDELEWIKTLSIMGKEYRPDPRKNDDAV